MAQNKIVAVVGAEWRSGRRTGASDIVRPKGLFFGSGLDAGCAWPEGPRADKSRAEIVAADLNDIDSA